jgi:hypothetical protein
MNNKKMFTPEGRKEARSIFDSIGNQVATALNAYDVPADKIEAVVEFAIKTLAKNRQMTVGRIVRKTVEQFKLKGKGVLRVAD